MTPWWELVDDAGQYRIGLDDGRVLVFEGGFGDDGGLPTTDADVALVARHLGAQARTEATFCDVLEAACDELICGPSPANDAVRAPLERVFALLAAPEKSTPAGESPPAG